MMVQELTKKLGKFTSFVVFSYGAVTAEQNHNIRGKLHGQGITINIVKNTLANVALKDLFGCDLSKVMKGPIALAYGGKSPVELAKGFLDASKKNSQIKVVGGILDGTIITAKQVDELAKIPSKEALLSSVAGTFNAPFQQILNAVNGSMQSLPNAFASLIAKLEKAPQPETK